LPTVNFLTNPFFGAAFGTDRPTTLIFNFLVSVGGAGALILIFAGREIWIKGVKDFFVFWLLAGMLVPDVMYLYVWLYLGVIYSIFRKDFGHLNNSAIRVA